MRTVAKSVWINRALPLPRVDPLWHFCLWWNRLTGVQRSSAFVNVNLAVGSLKFAGGGG